MSWDKAYGFQLKQTSPQKAASCWTVKNYAWKKYSRFLLQYPQINKLKFGCYSQIRIWLLFLLSKFPNISLSLNGDSVENGNSIGYKGNYSCLSRTEILSSKMVILFSLNTLTMKEFYNRFCPSWISGQLADIISNTSQPALHTYLLVSTSCRRVEPNL
jgi:hypothetical protein